jgi:death-on-curing family protein
MKGNLSYCIETAFDKGNNLEILESCIVKAAYYIHCISLAHGLLDCNKRTGYQAGEIFLRANGYRLRVDEPDEVVEMLRQVATKKVGVKFVEEWVRRHIKPVFP